MVEWEVARECTEGYNSGYNSDCSSGDKEAEVTTATMKEWDRQHGWLDGLSCPVGPYVGPYNPTWGEV